MKAGRRPPSPGSVQEHQLLNSDLRRTSALLEEPSPGCAKGL